MLKAVLISKIKNTVLWTYFINDFNGDEIKVTKADLKNATGIDTSKVAAKSDLASLKDKLIPVPANLYKLNDLAKNKFVKETVYDKLVAKVNIINISRFVLKTKYDTDKSDLESKISDADKTIPDTSGLVRNTDYNAKITKLEKKPLSISGLATTSALTTVENKIPNVSSLGKKISEISEIERKLMIIVMINILLLQNLISLQ